MSRSLTLKQQKFVAAYLGEANGNGTLAAKLAGYTNKNPSTAAWVMLRRPAVRAAIEAARPKIEPLHTELGLVISSREDRQAWLTYVYQCDEIDIKDRLKACELLCKAQGDFVEHRIVEDRREAAKLSDEELYSKVRDKVFEHEGLQLPWNKN